MLLKNPLKTRMIPVVSTDGKKESQDGNEKYLQLIKMMAADRETQTTAVKLRRNVLIQRLYPQTSGRLAK